MATTPLRVLVVEDNPDDAELIILTLSRRGYDPSWTRVETEAEMRAALAEGPWDAVLSDYTLPDFGAAQALALARQTDPDVPFIVITGTIGEEKAVVMMRAGASDYLLKHSLTRLASAVLREVEAAASRKARRAAEQDAFRLAAIVASTEDAVISENLDGIIVSWNPGAEHLFGWTAADMVGHSISELVPADLRDQILTARERVRASGRAEQYETLRLRRDGSTLDVSVTLSPILDVAGRVTGFSRIMRDISERRRAIEELAASERRFRALVEKSYDAVVLLDATGVITYASPGCERMGGSPIEQFLGRSMFDFVHPDDLESFSRRWRVVLARPGESVRGEVKFLRADGTFGVSETNHTNLLADPVIGGVVANIRDITERVEAEAERLRMSEELKRTNQLLMAVADNTTDAIFVKDRTGKYLLFNAAAARFVGRRVEDVLGQDDTTLFEPEGARVVMENDRRVIESGQVVTEEEELVAAGVRRVYQATKTPYRDQDGRVIGLIGISRDVTEQAQAEEALRQSERRYRTLLDRIPEPLFVYDRETLRYLAVNDAAVATYGYTRDEFLGMTIKDIRPAGDVPALLVMLARSPGGFEDRGLWRHRKKDGTVFDVEITAHDIELDGRPACIILARDITERKRIEIALSHSEERFRLAAEATGLGIYDWDLVSNTLKWDEQFSTIFGVKSTQVPTLELFYNLLHPNDVGLTETRVRSALDPRGDGLYRAEYRVVHTGGNLRWVTAIGRVSFEGVGDERRPIRFVGTVLDITEQKHAEERLIESEAKLAEAVRIARMGYWSRDYASGVLEWSEQLFDIFGVAPEAFGGKLDDFLATLHPEDREPVRSRIAAAELTGQGFDHVYRVMIDGEIRHIHEVGQVFTTPAGQPYRLAGTAQDVTEQSQAEESRRLLGRAVEAVSSGIVISDANQPDKPIIYVSPGFERMTGYSTGEILGRNCRFLQGRDTDRAAVAEMRQAIARGESCDVELLNYRKDGSPFWNALSIAPVLDDTGRLTHFIGVQTDVTKRREAEQALHLRDRAIQGLSQGILIADATRPDFPVVYASPGYLKLSGYDNAEVMGTSCRLLYGPNTDPEELARMQRAVEAREGYSGELLCYRKDGTTFWDETHLTPFASDDRVTHYIGVHTDVTARRKLESQFHQAQKMEAVGQLAGGVAHDFNNLLTVINGYGEIVHDSLPTDHPSRELVAEITKAGDRAAGLTRQLLAFSRQAVLEPKMLDPNDLIRDVEKMLRRLIGEDIDLAAKLASDLGRVKADPGQLEQAVVNLCVNARDAMPTGGRLTVETRNIELDAAYVATHPDVRPGPHVVIAVSDTGTGMTPEVQAHIFEPFFTTKGVGKGTGLGLAMVFGFVKQSGGHVGVHSEVGRGTTFKLYFPRVADAPLSGKSSLLRTPMPRGTETILLVEDEDAVRALGRHVLGMCGYKVLEAGNGREAVKAADGHAGPIHLLMTDVVMPGGMGGRQVAEAVVARHPGIKVLFTSGYTDDAVVRHGVLEEGTHFLQKPFTPAALSQKVREVLDAKG